MRDLPDVRLAGAMGISATSPSYAADIELLKGMLSTKRSIIIISGAGISTNTGIPDYQSSSRSNNSSQIVYHATAYLRQETTDRLNADLLQKLQSGQRAMFTMFDMFAEGLAQSGRLRRHYAQNIDCRQSRLAHLSRKTVWLHGRADTLVCRIRPSHTIKVTPESFPRWVQASCPLCEEEQSKRAAEGKRRRNVGTLRTSVLLYGEDSPSESSITAILNYDLEHPVDAILIIGTRLSIPSLFSFADSLCRTVRNSPDGLVAWVSRSPPTLTEAFRSLINFEYLGDCDEFSRQLLPLLIQMADENIRGMKEDLARLMTGLATLDGLLGDPGLLQQSNTQNAASHRTALPGGTMGANGDHGKDNGIATGQIDFAVFLSRVKTEVENFRSGLVSLQSRIEEQEMTCAGPPEEDAEEDAEGETEGAEGYQYHAAIEDAVTPQLLQPVSGRDHEPEVDSERALEVSEAPKGKRKAGLHTANTKKQRTIRNNKVDAVAPSRRSERIQGLNHQNTLERSTDEAAADNIRGLVSAVLSKEAIQRFVEVVKHSKKPRAEQARKPLDELDLEDGNPAFRSIAQRGRQLSYSQERTTFERIFTRYDQLQYARGYQALKDDMGYDKLPPYVVAEVCRMNGVSKETSKKRNKTGNQWNRVCAKLKHGAGLLAFLPSSKDYLALAEDGNGENLRRFHHELQSNHYFESICAVSIAWFEAVDQGKQFRPSDDVDWEHLEERDVLEALERLTAIR
ncbi:hypothetical protein CEP52_014843 [Fusarium oligoseptatum]|uniref:Deacetylase sirtuin-type domain-containing protein n=1 Tax=Fusarium oligoseptatum TaxID=2604345 RepID=A0A428SIS4_9HYPO|nr:hypothetical protein CEP52_014843 [Fusarium oligoseptatum]